MKLNNRSLVLVLFACMFILSQSALAGPRFSIVGAGTYTKPVTSGWNATYKEKIGFGGGLQAEFRLGSKVGLELGALYLQRKTDETFSGLTNTTTMPYIVAPLLFRLWLNPTISLGAGGYYAKGYGKIKSGSTTVSYTTFGIKSQDYGVMGALGFNIKLSGSTALLIDGRYALGLANASLGGGTTSFKNAEIDGLIGLRFGGGNK